MPTKGSIADTVNKKIRANPRIRGSASAVQAKKARARKKEIREEKRRKKQEAKDIRRAKLLSINAVPTDPAKAKKFRVKAVAKAEKRRAKKAARRR